MASKLPFLILGLTATDQVVAVRRYRRELDWMAVQRDCDVLVALLEFYDAYGKTPNPISVFQQYLVTRPLSEGLLVEVDDLATHPEWIPAGIDQIVTDTLRDLRQERFSKDCGSASLIAIQGYKKKNGEQVEPSIPTALAWLNARTNKFDFKEPDAGLWLHSNTDELRQEMAKDHSAGRVFTGFKSIDRDIILSKKVNPFWVIPGFAHEGKSTVLTSLLYEFLSQPLKIAYFSKEHETKELMVRMAFLHAYRFQERGWVLPSMNDWFAGRKTRQDLERMREVIDDLETLPGKIVFHRLTNWDDALAVLNADKYDVCAMDYLAIIDTPGVQERNKNEEIRRLVGEAFNLTRTYRNGEGIIFITPTHINRQGKKDSLKKEGTEKKYDLTAIAQHSSLYQDADFVWSLYSDDDMKAQNKWVLEVHKIRMLAPQWYPIAVLLKDYRTGYVKETVGTAGVTASPISQGWQHDERKINILEEEFKT